MSLLKEIVKIIFSGLFSGLIWYGIFYFLIEEKNMLEWVWYGKILYLLFSWSGAGVFYDMLKNS